MDLKKSQDPICRERNCGKRRGLYHRRDCRRYLLVTLTLVHNLQSNYVAEAESMRSSKSVGFMGDSSARTTLSLGCTGCGVCIASIV